MIILFFSKENTLPYKSTYETKYLAKLVYILKIRFSNTCIK